MGRAANMVGAALMLTTAAAAEPAEPARTVEVGAFAGQDSSNVYNTGPCPVLIRGPSAPADECVSNPHHGDEGIVVGAHVRYRVLHTLDVEAGLTYAQKGYDDGNEVRMHYLEAPLLVRFDPLPEGSPTRVFVVGGLSPAVLVACHETGQFFVNDPPPHAEMYSGSCAPTPYLDKTPDRFDLSGVVGVGAGWRFGSSAIEVQVRMVHGLIDVGGWQSSGKTVNDATYVVAGFDHRL